MITSIIISQNLVWSFNYTNYFRKAQIYYETYDDLMDKFNYENITQLAKIAKSYKSWIDYKDGKDKEFSINVYEDPNFLVDFREYELDLGLLSENDIGKDQKLLKTNMEIISKDFNGTYNAKINRRNENEVSIDYKRKHGNLKKTSGTLDIISIVDTTNDDEVKFEDPLLSLERFKIYLDPCHYEFIEKNTNTCDLKILDISKNITFIWQTGIKACTKSAGDSAPILAKLYTTFDFNQDLSTSSNLNHNNGDYHEIVITTQHKQKLKETLEFYYWNLYKCKKLLHKNEYLIYFDEILLKILDNLANENGFERILKMLTFNFTTFKNNKIMFSNDITEDVIEIFKIYQKYFSDQIFEFSLKCGEYRDMMFTFEEYFRVFEEKFGFDLTDYSYFDSFDEILDALRKADSAVFTRRLMRDLAMLF